MSQKQWTIVHPPAMGALAFLLAAALFTGSASAQRSTGRWHLQKITESSHVVSPFWLAACCRSPQASHG